MKFPLHGIVGLLLVLFVPCHLQAMTIDDFARINDDDEATYLTEMVSGTADYLKAQGHPDQAAKVLALFKDSTNKGGIVQFATNLKMFHSINNRNASNPNNRESVYEVEDAMSRTLSDNDIKVTVTFLKTLNQNFQPTGPRHTKPAVAQLPVGQ